MALLRAELLKVSTTRLWWVMLLVMLGYVALLLGFTIYAAGVTTPDGQAIIPARDTAPFQEVIWGTGVSGAVFAAVLGVVMMTGEYRYQTITTTLLATPKRVRVVVAKLGAGLVVGLLLGVAVLVLTGVTLVVTVLLAGGELTFTATVARVIGSVLVVLALYALAGVGLGALIKNQVGALSALMVWVFVIESLVNGIPALRPVGKWTPSGATQALTNTGVGFGVDVSYLLPAWAGGLVLLGYGLIFSAIASATTLRRDIT
ncbi:ABC-2 family transporter protein [Nonomuraea solani]|uniref:ABC-2 family transporter protein n=1 Tax=Nonomuraea solani TaxID=1144553 RepID=A0A1H6F2G1_9ACTN|nr:ABC transporter permease [Nonomuraea solani]SEH03399.1 ABC-2 family transporter protein [Nonomuraea solani]